VVLSSIWGIVKEPKPNDSKEPPPTPWRTHYNNKLLIGNDGWVGWRGSQFGFMPPLELLKLWMDNGFWYDRQKQEVKKILNMQLLCAMAPPGGGRNRISQRIQACFSLVIYIYINVGTRVGLAFFFFRKFHFKNIFENF
jgi:hypothetical protein